MSLSILLLDWVGKEMAQKTPDGCAGPKGLAVVGNSGLYWTGQARERSRHLQIRYLKLIPHLLLIMIIWTRL